MIPILVDYASPSVLESGRERALLGISASARRPVRFHGRVIQGTFHLRVALRALGQAIWSDDTWFSSAEYLGAILDPVITVHPDRLMLEAFSQDQSVYAAVLLSRELFQTEGEVRTGTTNVDFSAWLWGALGELRSSRETWLRVDPGGFEVRTAGAGGRFEQKVDLPEAWVRGFLQLQGAMALPGTRLRARPVDLLAALRYLRYAKARISPRALRYELDPGREARLVLEPWEHAVTLRGAEHGYTERRVIRTWGRRRLRLIEPLLPFAESVEVFLKGRALPSFYAVKLPGITFLLGLSGWTAQRFTESGSFDLLAEPAGVEDEARVGRALDLLAARTTLGVDALAAELSCDRTAASRLLVTLCRRGRAIFDVERREYRHRELFERPIDEARLYPPDARRERCQTHLDRGAVRVSACAPRETRKVRKLPSPDGPVLREVIFRDWQVEGTVGGEETEIVISDEGRIIFGRCRCAFFAEHLLNRGPCEHMLALFLGSEAERRDLPSARAASEEMLRAARPGLAAGVVRPRDAEGEADDGTADEERDDA